MAPSSVRKNTQRITDYDTCGCLKHITIATTSGPNAHLRLIPPPPSRQDIHDIPDSAANQLRRRLQQ